MEGRGEERAGQGKGRGKLGQVEAGVGDIVFQRRHCLEIGWASVYL